MLRRSLLLVAMIVYPLAALPETTEFRETAVSPDGRWLSWTVMLRGKDSAPPQS